jgi:hypothetical protein
MPTDCTQDSAGCITCPYIPPTAPIPGHLDISANASWNAGADSVLAIDGDLHLICAPPLGVAAEFCGFRSDRTTNFIPELIDYGFAFQNALGLDVVSMVERGIPVAGPITRHASWTFEIIRTGRFVRYNVFDNTSTRVATYLSLRPSFGPVLVNGCIYLSGDELE